ncbi:MAG: cation:proton antiporter [Pirellulales bacterium]|nr:cation:proton antiporter [Pirellulales bacterium]
MHLPDANALWTLGLLMGVALAAGGLGRVLHLPKVTTYLLAGMVLGPSVFNWVPEGHIKQFEPLTELAIALVLFHLGCHFPMVRLRRIIPRVARLSAGELFATFALVALGTWLLGQRWDGALLLGAMALATAPATTILMLKEMESEGPLTEYTQALVAINNLVSIVVFELLFVAVFLLLGRASVSPAVEFGGLALDLAGSFALGALGGLLASFCYPLLTENRRLVLLVALVVALLGACRMFDVPYLLTFLTMGFVVANTTYHGRQMNAEMDRITALLSVLFFAIHGAALRLPALVEAGMIGMGYVVLRISGKYLGIFFAPQRGFTDPVVRRWLGAMLTSQAGAAIALSGIADNRYGLLNDPLGNQLKTIILGTVVVFEIVGPLLIRAAVIRSGEVPLAQAVPHGGVDLADQARTVWNRLLAALGRDPWRSRSSDSLNVGDLMRKKVNVVNQSATFGQLIEIIEHSRDNTYPVVGGSGELIGVIRYRELSSVLFDPSLGTLVRAADVTTPPGAMLYDDEPVSRACSLLAHTQDDCIPVVNRDEPRRFVGLVRRRDVLRLLIRGRLGEDPGS